MKKVMTSLALIVGLTAYAQVGINASETQIKADAVFQVDNKAGENKGVILPSVSLSSTTHALNGGSDNSDGLLVWNTGGNLATGYYYWDGDVWTKVGNSPKNVGSVYQKVRVFRGSTFTASDIQDDDYLIAFTDAEGFSMPTVTDATDKYKNRTICIRNTTTAPEGTGAKQVIINNVFAGGQTINAGFTRCYTSFKDTDNQWKWISTSF